MGAEPHAFALLVVTLRIGRAAGSLSLRLEGQTSGLSALLGLPFSLHSKLPCASILRASRCHAAAAHNARLPSDSGHKQLPCGPLGLYPSLRSRFAVRNAFALLR